MSFSPATSRIYRFAKFRLNPAKHELWCENERVGLQPKAFDCLAYLVEHRERAVGRDELIAAVWGKVDITDNIVSQVISLARRAVGDSSAQQQAIRTVLHFGYAWVAPTDVYDEEPAGIEDLQEPASLPKRPPMLGSPARRRPGRRFWIVILTLAIASGLLALVLRVVLSTHSVATPAPSRVKAQDEMALVLPVSVKAGDGLTWMRLGLMDLIAERLRAAGQPVVLSDSTVAMASGIDTATFDSHAIEQFAKKAGVRLILDAHAESTAKGWRITLRTIYGHDGQLSVEGEQADALDAARSAADRMAVLLGWTAAKDQSLPPREAALARLVQRVKADILANRIDEASTLVDSTDAEQQEQPEIRLLHATIELTAGHFDAAQATYASLIGALTQDDDPALRARALSGLADTYGRRFDYANAERYYSEAITLLQPLGTPDAQGLFGRVLNGRGYIESHNREFDAAQTDFAQARVLLESTGDRISLATLDNNLGALYATRAQYNDALPLLKRAANGSATFHNVNAELFVRVNISSAELDLLDPTAALAEDARISELLTEVADPMIREIGSLTRVEILTANGRLHAANDVLQQQMEDKTHVTDPMLAAWVKSLIARRALFNNDPGQAARAAQESLSIEWDSNDQREYAETWSTLLRAQLELGQTESAAYTVTEINNWATRIGTPVARIHQSLAKAEYAASVGKPEDAKAAFKQALKETEVERVPLDLLWVSDAYASYLIQNHDLADASVVIGHLAGWSAQDYDVALLQLRLYRALEQPTAWHAALARAMALADERAIPPELQDMLTPVR
jgi:DNA-binding winged helix-turn-helix (wHTH) protein/tetratricopeptide (TPR) repeat protein